MTVVDPRDLGDIDLLLYLAMGPLPRKGWPNRGRLIARRLLELAAVAVATTIVLVGLYKLVVTAIVLGTPR